MSSILFRKSNKAEEKVSGFQTSKIACHCLHQEGKAEKNENTFLSAWNANEALSPFSPSLFPFLLLSSESSINDKILERRG